MLPNQSSNSHPGFQGQDRRQNSTSTDFDNLKISTPPRQAMHHRGQSFDQMTPSHGLPILSQEDLLINTNPKHMQHAIPETQPRPMARPGQRRNNSDNGTLKPSTFAPDPTTGTGCLKNDLSLAQINDMTDQEILEFLSRRKKQSKNYHSSYPATSAGSLDGNGYEPPAFAGTMQRSDTKRFEHPDRAESSRRSSVQSSTTGPQRPCTPPTQSNYCPFPMTPDPTPHRMVKIERTSPRMSPGGSPSSRDPNQTIKALQSMHMSCKDFFDDQQLFHETSNVPSPPASASLDRPNSFAMQDFTSSAFLDLSTGVDFAAIDYTSSHCSPMSSALSPTMSSFQSSPILANPRTVRMPDQNVADFALFSETSLTTSPSAVDLAGYSPRRQKSTHSRAQSASGIDSGLTTVDTGISSEEVSAFISGPNNDQKWTCMYPNCGKNFGRKENIKSHVQTHLGDRQFLCIHCNKRFVRQHDLKRHEKIHTGVKPYPCECGHSFARMDALTRHKQRNTCIGGIGGPEGMEKKEIKRGRPRKHRPDTVERLNKASRTRQRVLEKKTASSVSGSSVCSFSSPPAMPDCYDTDASAAFPSPPHIFTTYHEDASAAMSRESSSSQYGTPPELDLCSSSPIASRFFDFDDVAETKAHNASGGGDQMSNELASGLVLTQAEPDMDQMLLEFTTQSQSSTNGEKDNDKQKHQAYMNDGDFGFFEQDPFDLGQDFSSRLEDLTKLETLSWRMDNFGDS